MQKHSMSLYLSLIYGYISNKTEAKHIDLVHEHQLKKSILNIFYLYLFPLPMFFLTLCEELPSNVGNKKKSCQVMLENKKKRTVIKEQSN